MTLADSSAWIEFLRATGSPTHLRMHELVDDGELHVTDVVVMEVLAGARDADHADDLRQLLARFEYAPTDAPWAYHHAAEIDRRCRRAGSTVRKTTDCLIAAVALRENLPVLHRDRDFDVIAELTGLRIDTSSDA